MKIVHDNMNEPTFYDTNFENIKPTKCISLTSNMNDVTLHSAFMVRCPNEGTITMVPCLQM